MAELPQYRLGEIERKLLTLYALRELGTCSNLQLIAFMAENDLMNYFDLQSSLFELSRGGQLIKEPGPNDEYYTITPLGEEAIGFFRLRLTDSALQRVDAAAPLFRKQMRRDRELYSSINHEGRNEYHTRLGIREGGMDLMLLDLSLPTAELAERFREGWADKAKEIYDLIISSLSGEALS